MTDLYLFLSNRSCWLLLVGLALLAPCAQGQVQFAELDAGALPQYQGGSIAVPLGDVDGDGDLDLFTANPGGYGGGLIQNRLALNRGDGTFEDVTATHLPSPSERAQAAVFGDLDGDGDLDLVLGGAWGADSILLNDGSGHFTDVTAARMPPPGVTNWTNSIAVSDFDGDGDLDLVLGGWTGVDRYYRNLGGGFFVDDTVGHMPTSTDSTLNLDCGDIDGDGDVDLVLAKGMSNRCYLNDGTGVFHDATAQQMPASAGTAWKVVMGDIDADDDLDLVFTDALYRNNGAGYFVDVTAQQMPAMPGGSGIALGDVDNDDDLDVVIGQLLFLNDGAGAFVNATASRMQGWSTWGGVGAASISLEDVDGDGDLDLITGRTTGPSSWGVGGMQDRLDLNLIRQIDTPAAPQIGQPFVLTAYMRQTTAGLVDVAMPYISTATASIAIPTLGTLGLDPILAVPLTPFLIAQPAGIGSVTVPIPNAAPLVGLQLYSQSILLTWPFSAGLSNVTHDVVTL